MQVILLQDTQIGSQALCAGVTVDVADDQAQAWIDAGVAVGVATEPVAAPKKPTAK